MFDMLRRQLFDKSTGMVSSVKNQIGDELDEPVLLGEPLEESVLKKKQLSTEKMVKHTETTKTQ